MDAKKKRKLQKLGGRVTTVAEFLDLSETEEASLSCAWSWPSRFEDYELQQV